MVRLNAQAMKMAMIDKCMTIRDLSNKTGIAWTTIGALLNNSRKARLSTIGKVAKALGVKPHELVLQE